MEINIDYTQAGILLKLIKGQTINPAEKRELISIELELEQLVEDDDRT